MARLRNPLPVLLVPLLLAAACAPADESGTADRQQAAPAASAPTNVIDVTASDYALAAPAEIPSGWVTFRFVNRGMEPHFFVLDQFPEGKTYEDWQNAASAFDTVMKARRGGMSKADAGAMLGSMLPPWFASIRQTGGAGIVMPGDTSVVTVKLVPGSYAMECYVKNAEGEFHAALGMARPLTVTEETSGAEPPDADVEVTVSADGVEGPAEVSPGEHTVAVHFASQPEAGLGNDVQVVRLAGDTDLAAVERWLDWLEVGGLRAPAPAEFLGGAQEMPAGNTAYFTVNLVPGDYAWITEGPVGRGLVQRFQVK